MKNYLPRRLALATAVFSSLLGTAPAALADNPFASSPMSFSENSAPFGRVSRYGSAPQTANPPGISPTFSDPSIGNPGFHGSSTFGSSNSGMFPTYNSGPNYGGSNPSWAEQQIKNKIREQMHYQGNAIGGYYPGDHRGMSRDGAGSSGGGGLSADALQAQRWENEFRQEHPGEPMPNAGKLQKMHMGEILSNVQRNGNAMRANRQENLQYQYGLAKKIEQRELAAQGISWGPAQERAFAKKFDNSQRDNAAQYLKSVEMSREINNIQEEERRRRFIGY